MFLVPVAREARVLSRLIDDRAFNRFFDNVTSTTRSPALDVSETDSGYIATLDVPGVTKDDLKVSVDGRRVTVQAQARSVEQGDADAAKPQADADRVVWRERATASYARTFTLPVEVNQAEAAAKLEHGVLTLTLPKRSPTAAQLTIN